jgi:adenylosuccinate synthase
MLDIDFGSYPYVTSSNTIASGVCSGLGVSPHRIGKVMGVFKAYCTRVGSGPFPTELNDNEGDKIRDEGREYGSTTGRPRRCGWLDLTALKYAVMLNGVNQLFMMKTDVLSIFTELNIGNGYLLEGKPINHIPFDYYQKEMKPQYESLEGWHEDISAITSATRIPAALDKYIQFIEKETGVPVGIVSVGPDRSQTVRR